MASLTYLNGSGKLNRTSMDAYQVEMDRKEDGSLSSIRDVKKTLQSAYSNLHQAIVTLRQRVTSLERQFLVERCGNSPPKEIDYTCCHSLAKNIVYVANGILNQKAAMLEDIQKLELLMGASSNFQEEYEKVLHSVDEIRKISQEVLVCRKDGSTLDIKCEVSRMEQCLVIHSKWYLPWLNAINFARDESIRDTIIEKIISHDIRFRGYVDDVTVAALLNNAAVGEYVIRRSSGTYLFLSIKCHDGIHHIPFEFSTIDSLENLKVRLNERVAKYVKVDSAPWVFQVYSSDKLVLLANTFCFISYNAHLMNTYRLLIKEGDKLLTHFVSYNEINQKVILHRAGEAGFDVARDLALSFDSVYDLMQRLDPSRVLQPFLDVETLQSSAYFHGQIDSAAANKLLVSKRDALVRLKATNRGSDDHSTITAGGPVISIHLGEKVSHRPLWTSHFFALPREAGHLLPCASSEVMLNRRTDVPN